MPRRAPMQHCTAIGRLPGHLRMMTHLRNLSGCSAPTSRLDLCSAPARAALSTSETLHSLKNLEHRRLLRAVCRAASRTGSHALALCMYKLADSDVLQSSTERPQSRVAPPR